MHDMLIISDPYTLYSAIIMYLVLILYNPDRIAVISIDWTGCDHMLNLTTCIDQHNRCCMLHDYPVRYTIDDHRSNAEWNISLLSGYIYTINSAGDTIMQSSLLHFEYIYDVCI